MPLGLKRPLYWAYWKSGRVRSDNRKIIQELFLEHYSCTIFPFLAVKNFPFLILFLSQLSKQSFIQLKPSSLCFYFLWLLISQCVHMEYIRIFELLKACVDIIESSNPTFIFGKDLFYIISARHVLSYHVHTSIN